MDSVYLPAPCSIPCHRCCECYPKPDRVRHGRTGSRSSSRLFFVKPAAPCAQRGVRRPCIPPAEHPQRETPPLESSGPHGQPHREPVLSWLLRRSPCLCRDRWSLPHRVSSSTD